jgi:hypothetical protein
MGSLCCWFLAISKRPLLIVSLMQLSLHDLVTTSTVSTLLGETLPRWSRNWLDALHRDQYNLLFREILERGEPYPVRLVAGLNRGLSWGSSSLIDNIVYRYRLSNPTPYADPLSHDLRTSLSKSAILRMPVVAACNGGGAFVLSPNPDMQDLLRAVDYLCAAFDEGKAVYFKRDNTVKGEGVVRISRTRNFLRIENYQEERIYEFYSDVSFQDALVEILSDCYVLTKPQKGLSSAACLQLEFDAVALKGLKNRPWELRLIVDNEGLVLAYGKIGPQGAPVANISQGADPYTVQQIRELSGRPKAFDEFLKRSVELSIRIHWGISHVLDLIALRHLEHAHFSVPFSRPIIGATFTVVDCTAVCGQGTLDPRVIEAQRQAAFSWATQQLGLDIDGAIRRVEANFTTQVENLRKPIFFKHREVDPYLSRYQPDRQ